MSHPTLRPDGRAALEALTVDLRRVFGNRLLSVSAYGLTEDPDADLRSIALVDRLAFEDIAACVPLAARWNDRGLAVPLLLERDEFTRTLDVFPLEYGEIIATHVPVFGEDPFDGITVAAADLRRACELQAKSHLIHLREGFLESGGDARTVARLIAASAPGLRRLLINIVTLARPGEAPPDTGSLADAADDVLGVPADLTREVLGGTEPSTIADPTALLARYLTAVERIWEFVDAWKR